MPWSVNNSIYISSNLYKTDINDKTEFHEATFNITSQRDWYAANCYLSSYTPALRRLEKSKIVFSQQDLGKSKELISEGRKQLLFGQGWQYRIQP